LLITSPEATNTGPGFKAGVRGRRPMVWLRRTGRGICAYRGGSFPIAHDLCLCVCPCVSPNSTACFFKHPQLTSPLNFQTRLTHACHPHAALGRHAQYTRATPNAYPWCWAYLVLGVEGAEGVCSKSKLPTTHNHHHHHHHHHHRRRRRRRHLLLQLLLKVLIVLHVIFKRRNPGTA